MSPRIADLSRQIKDYKENGVPETIPSENHAEIVSNVAAAATALETTKLTENESNQVIKSVNYAKNNEYPVITAISEAAVAITCSIAIVAFEIFENLTTKQNNLINPTEVENLYKTYSDFNNEFLIQNPMQNKTSLTKETQQDLDFATIYSQNENFKENNPMKLAFSEENPMRINANNIATKAVKNNYVSKIDIENFIKKTKLLLRHSPENKINLFKKAKSVISQSMNILTKIDKIHLAKLDTINEIKINKQNLNKELHTKFHKPEIER